MSRFRRPTLALTPDHDDWRRNAACRDSPPETMFPHSGYKDGRLTRAGAANAIAGAKAICERCPVAVECLTFALEHDERFGIWGGLTEDERAAMHRRRGREEAECGTDRGYKRHIRLGEPACTPCRTAHADKTRQDYGRRKAAGG